MQTIQTAFTLGKTVLPRTAVLAPMAGVADRAYRLLCRSFGAAATVSEMVSVKGLCYGDKGSAGLCTITEPERPMGLQLFGSEPEFVGKAAALVQQYDPDWIDINMGCPVHKVVATGAGSEDMLGSFICAGIGGALMAQIFVNVGMNLRVLPVIGVTLPFYSAGGSSVLMLYICVGLVLSVYMHNTKKLFG